MATRVQTTMPSIHDLVRVHGPERAVEMAETPEARKRTAIAIDILREEGQALGVTYSGFCLTGLPHKRLPDDQIWERATRNITLLVEPMRVHAGQTQGFLGVPFGSRARLILLYLQTEAIRNNSREIELGRSMHEWLQRMGVRIGGKTYQAVREQALRISACRLTFKWHSADGRSTAWDHDHIIKAGFTFNGGGDDGRQGTLWNETVRLGETFFDELRRHPVPIFEPAIRHIANQSLTMDIYIWLAYRLHSLEKATPVSWFSLRDQFGHNFSSAKSFKEKFIPAVKMALAVYPQARVDFSKQGLLLYPSPPPIEKRLTVVKG